MTKLRLITLQVEDYCRNNGLELTVANVVIALVVLGYVDIAAQPALALDASQDGSQSDNTEASRQ